jgi:L-aminopeptidase/D-esterase-like protein
VIATDAQLNRAQAKRVALMAHDGFARAIRPVHTPLDGDTVFVLATGATPLADPVGDLARLGMLAADCAARAITRGVYEATALAGWPAYRDLK